MVVRHLSSGLRRRSSNAASGTESRSGRTVIRVRGSRTIRPLRWLGDGSGRAVVSTFALIPGGTPQRWLSAPRGTIWA
jgi:hypothetical protein